MAKPQLVVDDNSDNGRHRIAWYFPEDGDIGGNIGEKKYKETDLAKAKPDDWDHVAASLAAEQTENVARDNYGLYWESYDDARRALRAIKLAVKSKSKPWPEWAVKASAAGWKAPKGWKP